MDTERYRPEWLTFPAFATFTTALTGVLVMLGIYTAATGSGLACSTQWPLCDGGVLPQTIPSFIEWFHRLVAMITGFFILGTALWSWSADVPRRAKLLATLAVVLLPLQVSIGAVTVTLNGALPSGYSAPTQAAHLLAALSIFTSLALATLLSVGADASRPPIRRARSAVLVALALLPVAAVFSRVDGLLPYDPGAQAAFYGLSLAAFTALLTATLWFGRSSAPNLRYLSAAALAVVFVVMLLGRDLVYYTPTVGTVNAALFVVAEALVAAAAWVTHRRVSRPAANVTSN